LCTHVYQKGKRKKKNLPGSSHRPGKSPSCETKHSGGGSVLCTAHTYFLLIRLNIECIKGIHRRGKRLVLFERFTNRLRHKKNPDGISSLHVDPHPPSTSIKSRMQQRGRVRELNNFWACLYSMNGGANSLTPPFDLSAL
jgi:hypothetical protein